MFLVSLSPPGPGVLVMSRELDQLRRLTTGLDSGASFVRGSGAVLFTRLSSTSRSLVDGQLMRLNVDDSFRPIGKPQPVLENAWDATESPDGRWIAFERSSVIYLIDSEFRGSARGIGMGPSVRPVWSHDGRWLVFSRLRQGVKAVNMATGEEVSVTSRTGDLALDVSRDGFVLIARTPFRGRSILLKARIRDGLIRRLGRPVGGRVLSAVWTRDNSRVLLVSETPSPNSELSDSRKDLYVWDPRVGASAKRLAHTPGQETHVTRIEPSPRG
jgi:hypothetical protein